MEHHCAQCGRKMNPVDALIGPVCGKCTRMNHQALTQHGVFKVSGDLEEDEDRSSKDPEERPHRKDNAGDSNPG